MKGFVVSVVSSVLVMHAGDLVTGELLHIARSIESNHLESCLFVFLLLFVSVCLSDCLSVVFSVPWSPVSYASVTLSVSASSSICNPICACKMLIGILKSRECFCM